MTRMSENQLNELVRAGAVKLPVERRTKTGMNAKASRKKPSDARRGRKRQVSGLESEFAMQCRAENLPEMRYGEHELVFHPSRKWRFDFAWEDFKVAVEAEGGTYVHGKKVFSGDGKVETRKSRHLTPKGYHDDCIKYSEAAILGWLVIRADAKMIRSGMAMELLKKALVSRGLSITS